MLGLEVFQFERFTVTDGLSGGRGTYLRPDTRTAICALARYCQCLQVTLERTESDKGMPIALATDDTKCVDHCMLICAIKHYNRIIILDYVSQSIFLEYLHC